MIRSEWKKLLWHRKGLLLIAVFLIAELAGILLFTKPYDKELEANRAVYDRYLSQVEGPLTEEKRQWLEAEMLRLNTANAKLEQLKTDYYLGDITEEAFRASFDTLASETADYPGFSKLYTQYIYVREDDGRSFLYTGGWEVLFGDQQPDYLFLLLLIFLLVPIFCQEYGNQMDQILLTQKKSAKYAWQAKVAVALVSAAVLTAVLQMCKLGYCALRFGLPHWDSSLQSLYSFGSAQKEMTLGQAFWLQFALKELGYLYAALLILCVSVVVKKYALALMAGIVLLPVPFLTVNSAASLCRVPGPWALTIGSIYLNGEGIQPSGGGVVTVPEVTWGELGQVAALSALICVALLLCIRQRNTNYHLRLRGGKALAAALAVMVFCTGCGGQKENVFYNSKQSNCFESERCILFNNGMDGYGFLDKQTGKLFNYPLDAFGGETARVSGSFYEADGRVYYLKAQQQAAGGNAESLTAEYALMKLDTDTMDEHTVYRWNQDSKWFFGLLSRESGEPSPYGIDAFFLHQGKLYYLNNGDLYAMDLQSGRYELYWKLPNPGTNLAYDGTNIYFTDAYNRLTIHTLGTDHTEALENVIARDFVRTPDGIYFLNIRDNSSLYFWNEVAQTAQKLDDTEAFGLYWDENYCWVNSLDGMFRLNHDGSGKTAVACPGTVCCIPRGSVFFSMDYETGTMYRVEKDTLQWEILENP